MKSIVESINESLQNVRINESKNLPFTEDLSSMDFGDWWTKWGFDKLQKEVEDTKVTIVGDREPEEDNWVMFEGNDLYGLEVYPDPTNELIIAYVMFNTGDTGDAEVTDYSKLEKILNKWMKKYKIKADLWWDIVPFERDEVNCQLYMTAK